MPQDPEVLENSIRVEVPRDQAFATFVDRLAAWWPQEFTFSEEEFETAVIQPKVGLSWFERDTAGEELEWGEVRAWDPPERLVLSWQIGPDRKQEAPDRASEVEVRFAEQGMSATLVTLTHRDFGMHGDGAQQMREGMASPEGWPGLLERFRRLAEGS